MIIQNDLSVYSNEGSRAANVELIQSGGAVDLRGKDVHHDSFLTPRSQSLLDFAEWVFLQTEALRPSQKRRSSLSATRNRKVVIHNLITNLMTLYEASNDGGLLVVPMRKIAKDRYTRADFVQSCLKEAIASLSQLGLIQRNDAIFRKYCTTIRPTDRLWKIFDELRGGPHVGRIVGAEPIVLKAHIKRGWSKPLVDYKDSKKSQQLREEMHVINEMLLDSRIEMNGKSIGSNFLKRYFQINNCDALPEFNSHGRLYGGFWQSTAKSKRHLIRLDGEMVCDLDYSSMFATLAYWKVGHLPPAGDLYACVEGLQRAEAKTALIALLSRSGPMMRLPESIAGALKLKGWTGRELQAAMTEAHPNIAPLFCKAAAMELMFIESQILVKCLLGLANKGISALPMHDGVMVAKSNKSVVISQMLTAAHQVLGRDDILKVVEKPILGGHFS